MVEEVIPKIIQRKGARLDVWKFVFIILMEYLTTEIPCQRIVLHAVAYTI